MPPEKKPEKKDEPAPKKDLFEELVIWFVGLLLLASALNGIMARISANDGISGIWNKLTPQGIVASYTRPISSLFNPIGARFAVTSKKVTVYDSPGGKKVTEKKLGDRGTIIGGSVTENGIKYWQVKFDDGTIGWVSEKDISALNQKNRPLSSISPNEDVMGKTVVSAHDGTAVYDSAGGRQIAQESIGAKGKIIDGPVTVNGVKYWRIRFVDGTDGWVAEGDLELVEDVEPSLFDRVIGVLFSAFTYLKIILWVLSGLLLYLIICLYKKLTALRQSEAKLLYIDAPNSKKEINPKWERIMTHIESQNENDWRLAILEADIMLDDLLDKLGLPGETMGDKLKAVEKSDFTTVDYAWEAHKVRNQIAHEGADFSLTAREAKRIIELYRSVFEEFKMV